MIPREPRYGNSEKGRISNSSLETYLKCGVRYLFLVQQSHRRTTVRMAIGTGLAAGAKEDNLTKIRTHRRLKKDDVIEIAVESYRKEVEEAEVLEPKEEKEEGVDLTAGAAKLYVDEVSPNTKKVIIAEKRLVAAMDKVELCGTPDVVTAAGIGDYKTGRRPWTQVMADTTHQLSAYGLLHFAEFGSYPKGFWIDSLRFVRKTWVWQRIPTTRSEEDYARFWLILEKAREGIEKEVFTPAPDGAWWCAPTWCEFYRICPYVTKGKEETNGDEF